MKELVSVIVPVYNTEKDLDRCVSSILSQTYRSIEVLLVDDGSTDKSGTICDEYAKSNDNVRVFHTSNHGAAHARNVGIQEARGEYITFVDSDDYIDDEMIDALMNDMITNDSDLSISSLHEEKDSNDFCISLNSNHEDQILFLSEKYLIFGPTQKMYKTAVAKQIRFPDEIKYGEDLLFNLEYLKRINRVSFISKNHYHYCRKEDSLSTKNRWDMFENDMILHKALQKWYEEIGMLEKKEKAFIYNRTFDTAVNSICSTFKKECPFNFTETKQLIETIVSDDMVIESAKYANIDRYAKWQVGLIKHKKVLILSVIAILERIFHA